MTSNHIIAEFNTMGILKPKGMVVYRWCCYNPYQTSTKVLVMKESKSMEAGMSQRVVQYRVVQKMAWLAVEPLLSQSTDHKTLLSLV